jgi:sulfide:quinone oxidoreductase
MRVRSEPGSVSAMGYAVVWREGAGDARAGNLELRGAQLELVGGIPGRPADAMTVALDEVTGTRIERADGMSWLVIERASGLPLRIASVIGVGIVRELSHELAARLSTRAQPDGRPLSVMIAGGGVAALEALLALRALAEERIEITLVSATPDFWYRPLAVLRPFAPPQSERFALEPIAAEHGARLLVDEIVEVALEERRAFTRGLRELRYDVLVVATGAAGAPAVPGAFTVWDWGRGSDFRRLLEQLARSGEQQLVFAVPGTPTWPLPLYELALLSASFLAERGATEVGLTVVTPEEEPLGLFGGEVAAAVRRLLGGRGIELRTGVHPLRFAAGALEVAAGKAVPADWVVALPRLSGRTIAGLPHDREGFLATDAVGHVGGRLNVFAIGDVTDFPVRQGGIAAQQAETVAQAIAAQAGAPLPVQPTRPILRAVMVTGDAPLYLRAELGGGRGAASLVSEEPLWWPASKIAAKRLAPYLARRAGETREPAPSEPN